MCCLTDSNAADGAQLLPRSQIRGRGRKLLFHFLWQNKRQTKIPVCKMLCKQNVVSNPNSKVVPYTKVIQGGVVALSRPLCENERGFVLYFSKGRF